MTYAQKLKALRSRHQLSQADAAKLLHVPIRTYEGYEQGREISSCTLTALIDLTLSNDEFYECWNNFLGEVKS